METRAYLIIDAHDGIGQKDFLQALRDLEEMPGVDFVDPVIGPPDMVVMVDAPSTIEAMVNEIRAKSWVKELQVLPIPRAKPISIKELFTGGQGFRILEKELLAPRIYMLRVAAPTIARKAQAGQFVVLRVDETAERIPLTIADWNGARGDITLVFMETGGSTTMLSTLEVGDSIQDVVGPLGQPTHIENFGTVVCVAGGVGVAPVYPIARAFKQAGNKVITVMGARNKGLLFWEEKLRNVSSDLLVNTDDGSYGRKALVTEPLKEILCKEQVGLVMAIGPAVMMKFCSLATRPFGIKTLVSLNPIMVDGTGMCGCCRVTVGDVTKFTCVDGPDFDGHKVEWDELVARQMAYKDMERHAAEDCKWRAFEKKLQSSVR